MYSTQKKNKKKCFNEKLILKFIDVVVVVYIFGIQ